MVPLYTISRVLCGGAAGRSGMIHSGDMLHEINGISVAGKTVGEVADIYMVGVRASLNCLALAVLC